MPSIETDDETYDRLYMAARLMDVPLGEIVRRLVKRLASEPSSGASSTATAMHSEEAAATTTAMPTMPAPPTNDWLPIFKIYKGHRVEGNFNPSTHEVLLITEPWVNKYFSSPTAAAVTVVEHYSGNDRKSPSTNGRKFWKLTSTGANLRSIMMRREDRD